MINRALPGYLNWLYKSIWKHLIMIHEVWYRLTYYNSTYKENSFLYLKYLGAMLSVIWNYIPPVLLQNSPTPPIYISNRDLLPLMVNVIANTVTLFRHIIFFRQLGLNRRGSPLFHKLYHITYGYSNGLYAGIVTPFASIIFHVLPDRHVSFVETLGMWVPWKPIYDM